MKVVFVSCSVDQLREGGFDDPNDVLVAGNVYEVVEEDVGHWCTSYVLKGLPSYKFNSVCFEPVASPHAAGNTSDEEQPVRDKPHVRTLRDEFAMTALAGLLAKGHGDNLIRQTVSMPDRLAHDAYVLADAMLKQRGM